LENLLQQLAGLYLLQTIQQILSYEQLTNLMIFASNFLLQDVGPLHTLTLIANLFGVKLLVMPKG